MERNYTVYMHICPKGLRYIGITRLQVHRRWNHGKGYSKNPYFWRVIQKYGWDNIEHKILFTGLSHDEAELKEKELISLYNTANDKFGYNCTHGGDSNFTLSDTARKRLSEAHKGRKRKRKTVNKYTPDGKYICSYNGVVEAAIQSGFQESLRSKITECCNGNRSSAGGFQWRYADSVDGATDIHPVKIRVGKNSRILQYDENGGLLNTFNSTEEVAKMLCISRRKAVASISNCALGKSKTALGYVWKYEDIDYQLTG